MIFHISIFIYNIMRYIKSFENNKPVYKVGDYVLIRYGGNNVINLTSLIDLSKFINNNFGIIVDIKEVLTNGRLYDINVGYYTAPPDGARNFFILQNDLYVKTFHGNNIVEYAESPEELELKLQANKYNL